MRIELGMATLLAMLFVGATQAAASSEALLVRSSCLKAVRYLEAETIPVAKDFVSTGCNKDLKQHVYRFDRACHCTRLTQSLTPLDIVAQYPGYASDNVAPGQRIYLSSAVGAVRVVSEVEALGFARPGQRVFVRTDTGEIFSARYEKARP